MNTTKFFQVRSAFLLALVMLMSSFKVPLYANTAILKAGTSINFETTSTIKSGKVIAGQVIDFRVTRDVVADGIVVIPAGSIAKGQVIRSDKAKGLGKPGFVEVQIKSVTAVDGQEIFLSSNNIADEGDDKATAAIVLGILICFLFLFKKGGDGEIPVGYNFNGMVASNATIEIG
jgi:hypothetical protein